MRADIGTKVKVIIANRKKYSISAMCRFLKVPRSSVYYIPKAKKDDQILLELIKKIFIDSRRNYGSRKIKVELKKVGYTVSRRKIRRLMNELGIVSNYTIKQFKKHSSTCNNEKIENILDRNFDQDEPLKVIVSDLTYVNVAGKWNYICFIVDLYNREIVGYSAGKNKTADLVIKAFSTIKNDLNKVQLFHTDRGTEFKNKMIEELLETFNIKRSLSHKGSPHDNAVAEATYKIVKTEFAFNRRFESFEELELDLFDYVNWYNNIRIHGSLGYQEPSKYKCVSL